MKPKVTNEVQAIEIIQVQRGVTTFCILGTSPIICHRLSEKAKYELLYPQAKKKGAPRTAMKHNPIQEFRDAPYCDPDPKGATLIQHLSAAFKAAIRNASLDIPGTSKAEIGRLCWVEGERLPIYGEPRLIMSPVRSSDMNRTPDIRTRCVLHQWATKITVNYVKPQLNATAITHLLAAAGMTQGIGDWRTQKGAGNFGSFQIVEETNPEFRYLLEKCGRKLQVSRMETPIFHDLESEELFRWFESEVATRGEDERRNPKVKKAA